MEITKKTISDNIEDRNANRLNSPAFESLGGTTINYKTFFEFVEIYAKAYKEMGVENGDMVTICSAGTLDTVINFAALNKIGAVVQFVNPNYFKYNSKKYINDTNSKLLICLDRFYPEIKDAIAETNVKKILLSSISEYSSMLFKMIARRKKISKSDRIEGIEYIELPDFIKLGEKSTIKLERIPYEEGKPSVITYTSGTTGNPKGVVHTNDSINNMIQIYEIANGFGVKEGDRNLVLIPPMYLTSFVHSIYAPMTLGTVNILQPIYNPESLGNELKKYEPVTVIASKAHYLNLAKAKLKKGSLGHTKYAYCGGEAISKATSIRINEILEYYGIPPMVIGYGQTEFGTMTMFNNDIPTRTNESGILIPEVNAKILDLVTGQEVEKGQRGELYIQTPAMMKGYLNNPEADSKFFFVDDNGETWAKTGDIAEVKYQHDGKDVYEVSGRSTDSFIDENGNVVYLFDIETKVEEISYVDQAEVVALTVDGKKVPVVHVILNDKAKTMAGDVLKVIDTTLKKDATNPNAIPYAYKIRDSFSTSPISGKRDYVTLRFETDGYLRFNEQGNLEPIEIISEESKEQNDLLRSNITTRR